MALGFVPVTASELASALVRMPAPFAMPGYTYDEATKRFFKTLPGVKAPSSSPASAPLSAGRAKKKARRAAEKGKQKAVEPSFAPLRSLYDSELSLTSSRRGIQQCVRFSRRVRL